MPNETPPPTKVAAVTGSSSGIGREIAIHLARAGFGIFLHARKNLRGLQETARLIRSELPNASVRACTADISCPAACQQLIQAAFQWHGHIHTWVNNAGADVLTGPAASLPFEERLQRLLAVDVSATIRLSRLVAARWQLETTQASESKNCIINIGWDQAHLGMEGEPGQLFGTCKTAVEAFTRSLALSVGPDVRVNCVSPGWIKTSWGEQSASSTWHRRAEAESIMQRWGTPTDVAQAVQWLASDAAAFVNGQIVPVNGGRRYYASPPDADA